MTPRIRLLIADDTLLMRKLLAQQLAQIPDFEVIGEAENGREAIDMCGHHRPDVVIMDLNMPGLNGLQATERISAQYPYIKIILLTGLVDLASLGRSAGAAEFLNKGCTPQDLANAIRRVHTVRASEPAGRPPAASHQTAIERIAVRYGLSESERAVLVLAVTSDLTIHQIGAALSSERGKPVSDSAVKHTLERVMTKLRMETRTRAALVKQVLEFDENRPALPDA